MFIDNIFIMYNEYLSCFSLTFMSFRYFGIVTNAIFTGIVKFCYPRSTLFLIHFLTLQLLLESVVTRSMLRDTKLNISLYYFYYTSQILFPLFRSWHILNHSPSWTYVFQLLLSVAGVYNGVLSKVPTWWSLSPVVRKHLINMAYVPF